MKHSLTDIVLVLLAASFLMGAQSDPGAHIEQLLNSYRIAQADQALDQLRSQSENAALLNYLDGKIHFYRGDYEKAAQLVINAIQANPGQLDWQILADRIQVAAKYISPMRTRSDKSGLFTFYYQDDRDEIVIRKGIDVLNKQNRLLNERFGGQIDPIQVIICHDITTLSYLSGLSVEQISSTATVAVTKFNRILLMSPGNIEGGYRWCNTLAHELTHVYISLVSADRAPIWLHEGIAKTAEQWWKGREYNKPKPEAAYLLDRAAREGRLIPLNRLHPSISHLPNQEDAALAYAQVASFTSYLKQRLPKETGLKQLLQLIARGKSVAASMKKLSTYKLAKLQMWWKEELTGTRQAPPQLVQVLQKNYRQGQLLKQDQVLDPSVPDAARKHIRIGDLLSLRGHTVAAAREYRWAMEKLEAPIPAISQRLAGAQLELKKAEQAIKVLTKTITLYPDEAKLRIQLGMAYAARKQTQKAIWSLNSAIAIFPFNKDTHCTLAKLYSTRNQQQKAKTAAHYCAILD